MSSRIGSKTTTLATLATLGILVALPVVAADESFDPSAYDKKAFEWTGYIEARPEQQWLRPGSAGVAVQYAGGAAPHRASRLGASAEGSAVLRHRSLSFTVTGHASWLDEPRGSTSDYRNYEAYAAWQIDAGSHVQLGKKALRWGKGYAWSPVAFLERAKDPTDPDLAREGFVMATGTWVRSLEGPLQTLALTTAVLPTSADLNQDFGDGTASANHLNPALKLYALAWDTDVDLIWVGRGSLGPRIGVDLSRNLGSQLEVHGEWARMSAATRVVLAGGGTLQNQNGRFDSTLIGLRYLTERDATFIMELFRNGSGYSREELGAFYDLAHRSVGNPALLPLASRAAAQGYNRPNAAQRYAYLRASQKEPFDIVDFTPSLSFIMNAADRSWSVIPELLYTGSRNMELRASMALNRGAVSTEYGERSVRSRVELRARLYF
ncbi:MAG: hypothetical protein RLY71_3517 [Pseudomonadota bacterium]